MAKTSPAAGRAYPKEGRERDATRSALDSSFASLDRLKRDIPGIINQTERGETVVPISQVDASHPQGLVS